MKRLWLSLIALMLGPTVGFGQTFDQLALIVNGSATGPSVEWGGGMGAFTAAGSFNSATVKLQVLLGDGVTWVDAGVNTTLTAAGEGIFYLPHCYIRAAVVGGPPSGIFAYAGKVPE